MEIFIPRKGYIPGEDIDINVDIENTTNEKIASLECKLKQIVTSHSQHPSHHTRVTSQNLMEFCFDGVPERSSKSYNEKLLIPKDIVPLNFDNCEVLDVKYELKIKAVIKGCHLNLTATCPIELGTVSLMRRVEPSAPALSILAGLGTPYPYPIEEQHETRRSNNQSEVTPPYLYEHNFGWTAAITTGLKQ